jgi:hypothetical protein
LNARPRPESRTARALAAALAIGASSALAAACFVDIDERLLTADASAPHPPADASPSDASTDGAADAGPARVRCGDAACDPPVSVCCASSFGDTDYRRGACSTRDRCQTGDYFACTRALDCAYPGAAGPLCCIVRLAGGAFTQTVCAAGCDGGDALCDPGDGVPCPAGGACRASLEFPVLDQCAPP